MKQLLTLIVTIFFSSSVTLGISHGSCDQHQYSRGVRICQATFFSQLNKETTPSNCSSFYQKARTCVNDDVISLCYKDSGPDVLQKAIERGLTQFGDEELYCKFGGIPSIKPVIIDDENVKCSTPVNATMVDECEGPFYDQFKADPGSPDLCILSRNTMLCQVGFLRLCHKAISASSIPDVVPMANVRCKSVQGVLVGDSNKRNNIIANEPAQVHHPTSWDVITPVIIIAVLMFLALIIGFCHYAKQERRKNKKENMQNKKKISEKVGQLKKNGAEGEPRQSGEELMPLSSVITHEKEDISQV